MGKNKTWTYKCGYFMYEVIKIGLITRRDKIIIPLAL